MEPAVADLKDEGRQETRTGTGEGGRRGRAPPLWLIVLVTTCVTVFAPVLVGLLLIARNSNARLAATQLRSVTANASGLAQLVVERFVAAESAAHYVSSFIRFSGDTMVYDSPHFYHTLAQALVSFDAFATHFPSSPPPPLSTRLIDAPFLPSTDQRRHASQTSATTCTG